MTTKLDEIEALSKAATPAPWENRIKSFSNLARPRHLWSKKGFIGEMHSYTDKEDAAFICTMRNNIDDLIAVARAAEKLRCHVDNDCCLDVCFA